MNYGFQKVYTRMNIFLFFSKSFVKPIYLSKDIKSLWFLAHAMCRNFAEALNSLFLYFVHPCSAWTITSGLLAHCILPTAFFWVRIILYLHKNWSGLSNHQPLHSTCIMPPLHCPAHGKRFRWLLQIFEKNFAWPELPISTSRIFLEIFNYNKRLIGTKKNLCKFFILSHF